MKSPGGEVGIYTWWDPELWCKDWKEMVVWYSDLEERTSLTFQMGPGLILVQPQGKILSYSSLPAPPAPAWWQRQTLARVSKVSIVNPLKVIHAALIDTLFWCSTVMVSHYNNSHHMSIHIGWPNHPPHLHHSPHQLESRTIQQRLCWLHLHQGTRSCQNMFKHPNTTVSFYIICRLPPILPHVHSHIWHLVGPPLTLQHQHDNDHYDDPNPNTTTSMTMTTAPPAPVRQQH